MKLNKKGLLAISIQISFWLILVIALVWIYFKFIK